MFRIVRVPSSASTELCLTEIIRSGSQMFVVCLVGVWQRNFEPLVCVCVCVLNHLVYCTVILQCTVQKHKISVQCLTNTPTRFGARQR